MQTSDIRAPHFGHLGHAITIGDRTASVAIFASDCYKLKFTGAY